MNNQDIEKFVAELQKNKNNQVRLKGDNNNPTKEVNYRYSGVSDYPAIAVKNGKKTDLYEFDKRFTPSNISVLITKWIMFSIKARSLSGTFYLVVSEKEKDKYIKIVDEKSLSIEIVTLK